MSLTEGKISCPFQIVRAQENTPKTVLGKRRDEVDKGVGSLEKESLDKKSPAKAGLFKRTGKITSSFR
jgi:hypothetical protein